MQGYILLVALAIFIMLVLIRARMLKRLGIKAIRFGELDKKDFIIPPFVALYFYCILAFIFDFPRFGPVLWGGVVSGWAGVLLCILAIALFVWGLISFGKSFRVGIDEQHPGKLVVTGAFSVSRNPLYVAFIMVLLAVVLIFPVWIFLIYLFAGIWLINRQIVREEVSLRKCYGSEYEAYCSKVRRYL